jgi:hypothetical protein
VTLPAVDAARGSQPAGGASQATSLTGMTSGAGGLASLVGVGTGPRVLGQVRTAEARSG